MISEEMNEREVSGGVILMIVDVSSSLHWLATLSMTTISTVSDLGILDVLNCFNNLTLNSLS